MQRAEKALRSAELLLKETDFETSVSRSYYAMFYATEALLLTKNLKFSSHKSVISLFGEHFVKTGIFPSEMGRSLSKTFEKRLIGDYSFILEISQEDAEKVLKEAKGFVDEIKEYLARESFYKEK